MGRKAADTSTKPARPRDDRFELRLEEAEKNGFKVAAGLAGLPLSAWIRERLRAAARNELEGFGKPVPFLNAAHSVGASAATASAKSVLPDHLRLAIMGLKRPRGWCGPGSGAVTQAACRAAVAFLSELRTRHPDAPLPRVAPSVMGGVALQWDFGSAGFMVKISSADESRVYFQEEGPAFHQDHGVVTQAAAIKRLLATRARAT
jgi:hypothetical protein